ncbi:EUKARYOTIC TRANSLATION INITIATION FACTOR 4B/4H [Salix purpurea]|uniref:EUKARYOTIC TRANSLATION INITIATION FACTOR 4B/4H n=1 Tax=Salix purpurea TaxID=77065 RepID=A0A9Q0V1V4_SALPP|nr:EUKARYOTIC TRANSLATION INITIATION FACTOR 4B/4H [Salix purpurea]
MGKSSKKSATKVEAAPAVSPAKVGKKGKSKREAEEALEKIVSAKKQKKNDGVAQAIQKAKVETKTLKKKKDDSSDSDDSSSEEEEVKVLPKKAVKPSKPPVKESSDSESDSGSDEEPPMALIFFLYNSDSINIFLFQGKTKTATPAASKVLPRKNDEDDSSESETDESDEDNAKATAQKKSSSDEESSSDGSESEEDSEDEKPAKTPKKNGTDVEMADADVKSNVKTPKTPVTPVTHENTGSKTLFVGNLSFQVERADVENFFKGAGEVADVRFALDADQRFRGFGHVEFTTAEAAQKALKLNGTTFLGRDVRLDLAHEKGTNSKDSNSFQKGGRGQSQTIFGMCSWYVQSKSLQIRSSLQEHFGSCGEIKRISIPTDYDTGAIKGMAYLEFNDADALSKAFELNGSQLGEGYLTVDEAKPKTDNRDSRDSGRGRGRGSGGRGRFDSGRGGRGGRFDSGRGGRGGRGRGTPYRSTAASGTRKTFDD